MLLYVLKLWAFEKLQKDGLSMSHGVTIRLVTKLGEGHVAEVLKWKKCLTNFLRTEVK